MTAVLDGDVPTAHVRCGADIRPALAAAGLHGAFIEYADPVCQGPVGGDDLFALRADWLARHYGGEAPALAARLRREQEAVVDAVRDFARVVLWFEHDSYDQLILARLLDTLSRAHTNAELALICVDRVEGHPRFVGLGQLTPEELAALWPQRVPVTSPHFDLGRRAWQALGAPSPEDLAALAAAPTPPVAPLQGALRRHLMELPWTGSGLALTESLALAALRDGATTPGAIFADLTRAREPLPFLGDTMFFAVLERMAAAPAALIAVDGEGAFPARTVTLTPLGEAVADGHEDWLAHGPPPRWVGGVRIEGAEQAWRWDAENDAPLPPAQGVR